MTIKSTKKSLRKKTKKILKAVKKISKSVRENSKKITPSSKKPHKKKVKSSRISKPKVGLNDQVVRTTPSLDKYDTKKIKTILVAQPKPENDKNPYTDLANRYKLHITFKPFISLEGIPTREFRRYKVYPSAYNAVIFTSRNTIDQFFKLCEDLKVKMQHEAKYYCMTESIALYLQKYILYRKRKVFSGDGTLKGLYNEITHHRDNEKYLLPCADIHKSDISDFLKSQNYEFAEVVILKTVPAVLKKKDLEHDMLVLFTPAGVSSLIHNFPNFKQRGTIIGAFGTQTAQAISDAGLRLDLSAPVPEAPSMSMAIDRFLAERKRK